MARGMALCVGLDRVDPTQYEGWDGRLRYAENDARDMAALAAAAGFDVQRLLTDQATRGAVLGAVREGAELLGEGDIFMLTYSGHGGQVADSNGDEDDGLDETLCLYDGQLIDDELADAWAAFRPGVRVLHVTDSCHSGTQFKALFKGLAAIDRLDLLLPPHVQRLRAARPQRVPAAVGAPAAPGAPAGDGEPKGNEVPRSRAMPQIVVDSMQARYGDDYARRQQALPLGDGARARAAIGASLMILPACRDSQESVEWGGNGIFTSTLKRVWNNGHFAGDYRQLVAAIRKLSPSTQTPELQTAGGATTDFERQRPFTI